MRRFFDLCHVYTRIIETRARAEVGQGIWYQHIRSPAVGRVPSPHAFGHGDGAGPHQVRDVRLQSDLTQIIEYPHFVAILDVPDLRVRRVDFDDHVGTCQLAQHGTHRPLAGR